MKHHWPKLDYLGWRDTCSALHLYLQVAGKYRLARTPWINHSWHATFYVTPQGLTSSLIPDGPGIEFLFDFHNHQVVGTSGDGREASFALRPMSVAEFHADFVHLIDDLGGTPRFDEQPNEVPNPVPFAEDDRDRPYDRDATQRFHQALMAIDRVFKAFRTSFLGKCSPVHLYWGSFDMAVTRFSGRRAPLHGGGSRPVLSGGGQGPRCTAERYKAVAVTSEGVRRRVDKHRRNRCLPLNVRFWPTTERLLPSAQAGEADDGPRSAVFNDRAGVECVNAAQHNC